MPQAYKVLNNRMLRGVMVARANDTVYACIYHDQGHCDLEEKHTGKHHTYVTKQANGAGPAFTIPSEDIQAIALFHPEKQPEPFRKK